MLDISGQQLLATLLAFFGVIVQQGIFCDLHKEIRETISVKRKLSSTELASYNIYAAIHD